MIVNELKLTNFLFLRKGLVYTPQNKFTAQQKFKELQDELEREFYLICSKLVNESNWPTAPLVNMTTNFFLILLSLRLEGIPVIKKVHDLRAIRLKTLCLGHFDADSVIFTF